MRNFKNDNELLGGNEMPTLYELKPILRYDWTTIKK